MEENELKYYFFIEDGKINGRGQAECVSPGIITVEVTEEMYNNAEQYGNNYYIYEDGEVVLNPNYEEEKQQERQEQFEREFFQTSLGWIRRQVTMRDGSQKDFISDLLPNITTALNSGTPVSIITYTEPDFTEDVTDWTQYQTWKQTTPQFIQECLVQLQNDFVPIN